MKLRGLILGFLVIIMSAGVFAVPPLCHTNSDCINNGNSSCLTGVCNADVNILVDGVSWHSCIANSSISQCSGVNCHAGDICINGIIAHLSAGSIYNAGDDPTPCDYSILSVVPTLPSIDILPFSTRGFYGSYYNHDGSEEGFSKNMDLSGSPLGFDEVSAADWYLQNKLAFERFDSSVDFSSNKSCFFPVNFHPNVSAGSKGSPDPQFYSAVWKACINATGGNYNYTIISDDDAWVYLNGVNIANLGGVHPLWALTSTMHLDSNPQSLTIYYADRMASHAAFTFRFEGANANKVSIYPYLPGMSSCDVLTTCTPTSVREDCTNEVDDNCDGSIDEEDQDCIDDSSCMGNGFNLGACDFGSYISDWKVCSLAGSSSLYRVCTMQQIGGETKYCWKEESCSESEPCNQISGGVTGCGFGGGSDCVWTVQSCEDKCSDLSNPRLTCTYSGNLGVGACTETVHEAQCPPQELPFFQWSEFGIAVLTVSFIYFMFRKN